MLHSVKFFNFLFAFPTVIYQLELRNNNFDLYVNIKQ